MERSGGAMVVLAIFVSRFEAITVASMLRTYGFHVSVDGEHHASVLYNSLALGGHRLRVMSEDYQAASAIIRDSGIDEADYAPVGPSSALIKLILFWAGAHLLTLMASVWAGSSSFWSLFIAPLVILEIPVDPKGRPDYFLAGSEG